MAEKMKKDVIYIDRGSIDQLITGLRRFKKKDEQGLFRSELHHPFLTTKDGRYIVLAVKKRGTDVGDSDEGHN